jgi:PAS domain S-box-containing protein
MRARLRQLAPIGLVLALTLAGFFAARVHGERDARHDSAHRAEIAGTRVHDRVAQAVTLVDGVRRFLAGHDGAGVTTEQFTDIGARWLSPVGLTGAAWVERRGSHLPATLVTGSPPMTTPGIDLGRIPGVAAAVASPQTAYRVRATSLELLADGTAGLFLVQSAQRVNQGTVEPGFVVLFIPASWLIEAAMDKVEPTTASGPTPEIFVGRASTGNVSGASAAQSTFTEAGQRFEVRVPQLAVQGDARALPWIVLGGGLLLAALVGALAAIATRRAKTKAEVDRLFTLSPDLIVVAGFDGYFKRVNPAFETLLGYTEQEALAHPFIEFVHPDDRERTNAEHDELLTGETTLAFENRYICKDGTCRWIEWTATPVPAERLIYAVARDVTDRRFAETEQEALRRVATLVAEGVQPEDLFAVVAEEVSRVVDVPAVSVVRYEVDGTATELANVNRGDKLFPVNVQWSIEGTNILRLVRDSAETCRINDYAGLEGEMAKIVRDSGIRSTVGVPIFVAGRLWGTMVGSTAEPVPLPEDTEARLANFTELVATAVANEENRARIARLAEEQAALRRVATLVAQGTPSHELFAAVVEEVLGLLPVENISMGRYESDETVTLAIAGAARERFPVGGRWPLGGDNVSTLVARTRRPARIDTYADAQGVLGTAIREDRIGAAVGTPIIVEGRLWGVMTASATLQAPLPLDTEERLASFTGLVATAIANAENRSELAASRARIVAAADETRRQIERDLHDGTQQRLVSLSLELRLAESIVPEELEEPRTTIGRVAGELNEVIDELREISRGIHPAILSEGGLGPALRTLARRSAVPVELGSVIDRRLPEPIEVAAYYVVSEALTNATKHANATRVEVETAVRDGSLRLSIRDDGVGGADPAVGSGLVGLRDRVEALGGSIEISSPAGQGTSVVAKLPVEIDLTVQSEDSRPPNRVPARSLTVAVDGSGDQADDLLARRLLDRANADSSTAP